jgi:hypothetical protein
MGKSTRVGAASQGFILIPIQDYMKTPVRIVDTWDEWCQVFNDIEFWRDEITQICIQNNIHLSSFESTFPGTHAVFLVNKYIVLKIFCPVRYNSSKLESDIHNHILVNHRYIPRILFEGKSWGGYDYIAFQALQGIPIREFDRKQIPHETIRELALFLVEIQEKTSQRKLDGEISCLVHNDLTEDHVLLNRAGTLTGVIDFGDAEIGHPSKEFPVLFISCFAGDDQFIDVFCSTYNQASKLYKIKDEDVAQALLEHPFYSDILSILKIQESDYSQRLRKILTSPRL